MTDDAVVRRRPKDRKQQIEAAARDLFEKHGFANVSMAMIASEVGITASALYRHFANKGVLLTEVVADAYAAVAPTEGALSIEDAVLPGLAAAVENRQVGTLWVRESQHLPAETREGVRALLRGAAEVQRSLIRQQRPDLSVQQAETIARAIQSLYAMAAIAAPSIEDQLLLSALRQVMGQLMTVELVPEGEALALPAAHLQPTSRRERLLLEAMRLFAENGYHQTSMAEIGAAASVTGPSIYTHFEDKAAVLRAVVERGTHALWADLTRVLAAHTDASAAVAEVVSGYVRIATALSPTITRASSDPEFRQRCAELEREYAAEWIALLLDARPELRPAQAQFVTAAAMVLIDQLSRTPHVASSPGAHDNIARLAIAVLFTQPV